MKKLSFVMVIALLSAGACEKNTVEPGYRQIEINKTTSDIIKGDNAFGFRMLNEIIASGETGNNIFISLYFL